jgi:menaquinol-cytochrome c reductase iron-sulfur subunit
MSRSANQTPSPAPKIPERRAFLQWLTYATGAVAAAILGLPLVGYLVGALRKHRVHWVGLGPPGQFPLNETRLTTFQSPLGQPWDGMAAHMGVYVRNLGQDEKGQDRFLVFAMNCAHLGCPVTWFPQSGLFMCPCHGGVYYENGERASGPPERGLFHCVWRIRAGQLEIQAPHLPTLQNTLDESTKV